ncbi:hypothetical protein Lgee_1128 [Legionella geestiana]|uniref:Uncharacterized protein n=1 Tax=Legionella geestiana TaxID=45065 RepID=A0A0W0TVW2_9GAMM|nr:hypothetical protein [Legionella geestiana]KTC99873.1 hypothetical protein Lgee_1128 [Legionella geestiana]QBS13241.1 hypothetical protein E4T54_11080 [Legionella geestiana]STX54235.1 Uncharacterised protein [Legionella geestiana]
MMRVRGFILPVCLLILGLASLLTLSLWQGVINAEESIAEFAAMRERFEIMDRIALTPVSELASINCIHADNRWQTLVRALREGGGCRVESLDGHAYYLLQDLGEDACLRVGDSAAHHWRVAVIDETRRGQVLMTHQIIRGSSMPCSRLNAHQVASGVVSWHVLQV